MNWLGLTSAVAVGTAAAPLISIAARVVWLLLLVALVMTLAGYGE